MFEGEHTLRDGTLHAYSFAELFGVSGSPGIPFGLLMKALINLADLVVGVPAGPYHLSMAKLEVPTIGIWTEHLPGWFDEPKPASMHVVSRNVRDHGLDRRPGSIADSADLEFRLMFVNTRIITGEQAVEAVEALL